MGRSVAQRAGAAAAAARSGGHSGTLGCPCVDCNGPPLHTPNDAHGSCTSDVGAYKLGAPSRPPIHHDNGFLQNPNDRNDPTPMPIRSPTAEDRALLVAWKAALEGMEAIQGVPRVPHNNLPDALAAYRHFLEGGGADRTFSYDRFVRDDASGATVLQNAIHDIQLCAERMYGDIAASVPGAADHAVEYQLTGSAIGVGDDALFPYPETENWQKAIGGHTIWLSATVRAYPPCPPEPARFTMQFVLHAEDRYNFNPGQSDINTGVADAANGRFEQTGLGHQYTDRATLTRTVTWSRGNTTPTTTGSGNLRKPPDNRRLRNRR